MKNWLKTVLLLMLALGGAAGASAQGGFYQNTVWKYTPAGAFPASGAKVTICTSAGSGQPCTPTVTVYSDPGLTLPVANPLAACTTFPQVGCIDGFGNFSFYAVPGPYSYTATGSGLNPYGPIPIGLSCIVAVSCVSTSANNVFTGSNTFKQVQATNFYADQYCAASIDVAVCINNTLAAMPSFGGYKFGTIRLDGFAPGTAWVWNTLVTISSPYVSIKGPGSAALQITASVLTGDHLRINTNPFIVSLAGEFGGFALVGGAQSNAVCVHMGDIIGATLRDLRCSNFTGTNAVGLWEDNVTNFTERIILDKVHMDGNTKNIKLTNTGGVAGTASFGHQRWYSVWINVGANQTGISYESGTLYSGTFNITENLSATTSTGVSISGLAYSAGPSTAWTGSLLNLNAETSAGSGTLFNVAAGSSCLLGGMITSGGGLTNTGAGIGACNMYVGQGLPNLDLSNQSVSAGVFYLGGVPGATGLPQFQANSASAVAGITASNYLLLRSGASLNEAHATNGDLGILGAVQSVNGFRPSVAGAADFGSALLPGGNLWLGTAATNNFKFQPAATAAARVVAIPDPGLNVNLAFNLRATSAAFATATTAGTCVQNTTAVTGATNSMVAKASPVSTPGIGAQWSAFVSSAGNVTINECAVAASAGGTIAFNIEVTP